MSAEIARGRLSAQNFQSDIEEAMELALARADGNDVPNGDHIRSNLIEPFVRIVN